MDKEVWWAIVHETLESLLDCKEIQPVHPKGNHSWVFIGRTDAEAETPILCPPDELTHWKRPWWWERLKAGGEGGDRGWNDWMASPTQWTWAWANSGSWWWTGRPGVLQSMGSQELDTTEWLNWTELIVHGVTKSQTQLSGHYNDDKWYLSQFSVKKTTTTITKTP